MPGSGHSSRDREESSVEGHLEAVWMEGSTEEEDLEEGNVSLVDSVILCLWDFLVEVPSRWGGLTSLIPVRAPAAGKEI